MSDKEWRYIKGDDKVMQMMEEPTAENGGNIDLRCLDGSVHNVHVKHTMWIGPKPTSVPDGWELTGRFIRSTGPRHRLALGEIAYSPYSESWKTSFNLAPEWNKDLWVARQIDKSQRLICYLIDHCEGSVITEEFLQFAYADYLKASE